MNAELLALEPTPAFAPFLVIPPAEGHFNIDHVEDLVRSRLYGRKLAAEAGFSPSYCTVIATVISELARNILLYAKQGEMRIYRTAKDLLTGLRITALDSGPGIESVASALTQGFSTSGGLGMGLSGVQSIADIFSIESNGKNGTMIDVTIWLKPVGIW